MSELPLHEQVGFDYAKALLDIRNQLTYRQIAEALGYHSTAAIQKILDGSTPSHIQGEAIWALYMQMFGKKPPLNIRHSEHTAIKS